MENYISTKLTYLKNKNTYLKTRCSYQKLFLDSVKKIFKFKKIIQLLTSQNKSLKQEKEALKSDVDILTNKNAELKDDNARLKDEINELKKQKKKPKIPPSKLEGPHSNNNNTKEAEGTEKTIGRGKHPRKKKTKNITIHNTKRIPPEENIPEGSILKGTRKYTVQDIMIQANNTKYELEIWQLPDGSYAIGKLPEHIKGHYGPELRAYVLHQYYGCRVTEPLLLMSLREMGIEISSGQLNNLLIEGKDEYHKEKSDLLHAGILATNQVQVDDTSARMSGKNGYTTIVGNEYFTFAMSSGSKSRINFFHVLHGGEPIYLMNEYSLTYLETIDSENKLGYLKLHCFEDPISGDDWEEFLMQKGIYTKHERRIVTEAALFAGLIHKGIPHDLGVHGDDAKQFNAFVRSLCWIHEERHFRKIIASNKQIAKEVEEVRDSMWELYKKLKDYKENPSPEFAKEIDKEFDELFLKQTSSPTLNDRLLQTHAKKQLLLRVLERPNTPLHNNLTETDAREEVSKRKVSGGTRSGLGRKCRDTFLSLKKTCCKLKINFWNYLKDREYKSQTINYLSFIISHRAAIKAQPP